MVLLDPEVLGETAHPVPGEQEPVGDCTPTTVPASALAVAPGGNSDTPADTESRSQSLVSPMTEHFSCQVARGVLAAQGITEGVRVGILGGRHA